MGSFLEVQTPEHSPGRFGFIVLDKFDTGQELLKIVEVVAFLEISAVISIDGGFDEEDLWDGLGGYLELHIRLSPINVPIVGIVKNEKLKVKSWFPR